MTDLTRRAAFAAPLLALAGAPALAAAPAGSVEALTGGLDRRGEALAAGSAVFSGDRLTAAEGAHADLRFSDGSSFSIGSGAALTIDEFIYSPGGTNGALGVDIKLGAFRYVSGQLSRLAPQNIAFQTPVATIGVRGTAFVAIVEPDQAGCIVLLPSPDGRPSAITVTTRAGMRVVDTPFEGVEVMAADRPPTEPAPWPRDRLSTMLGLIGR